jgi:hypothetical protein
MFQRARASLVSLAKVARGARVRRRLSKGALSLVTALAVLFTVTLAGRGYFYCAPMAAVSLEDCCAHADDEERRDAPEISAPAHHCCEAHTFGTPNGGVAADAPPHSVPPPALAASVSLPAPALSGIAAAPQARFVEARAGPRRGPLEHRVPTIVSLS